MKFPVKNQLHEKICTELMKSDFIEQYHFKKEYIQYFLQQPYFISRINKMAEYNDYSCKAVYLSCKNIFKEFWHKKPSVSPLYYIYQYTLSKSFSGSVEITLDEELEAGCRIYLIILRIVSDFEKNVQTGLWRSRYPLNFLTEEELNPLIDLTEYIPFIKAFRDEYIYEMMKLNYEIMGHNTLDHICGVHYLSLFIAKQLYNENIPINLGRISGAAAGHDIGKYGCRSFEAEKVPYLHYYYTEQWFKKHSITYIGHIALNHSVWDLELENLSLESLILIYSDFRVKNVPLKDNEFEIKIISLKESFETILNKLDNMDYHKERRYARVYAKLKDFENYLLSLGIQIDIEIPKISEQKFKEKHYPLMHGSEITENIKHISIHHNINLMYKLRDESSLNEIIEIARGENDPHVFREYLDIFDEYSTYLTQKQKITTIRFIFEKIIHPEEDIRRQCAQLIGKLIGTFDEGFRKEVPADAVLEAPSVTGTSLLKEYLHQLIYPDHKIIPLHQGWIRYNIGPLLKSLFYLCKKEQVSSFKEIILNYYDNEKTALLKNSTDLLEALKYIPLLKDEPCIDKIYYFISAALNNGNIDLKVSAIDAMHFLLDYVSENNPVYNKIKLYISGNLKACPVPAENYLKLKIAKKLSLNSHNTEQIDSACNEDMHKITEIFLSNLKTATGWKIKKIHIDLLLEYTTQKDSVNTLYAAMHFCNLLKVSAVESVRNLAGDALVNIFPCLPMEQKNDIAVDLIRALEIEGTQFTKYIPGYLGRIILYLQPEELDEVIDDLINKVKNASPQINSLLLRTIGIFIAHYPEYKHTFNEKESYYYKRLEKMLGILLNGLVHEDTQMKQISFSVIGKEIFGAAFMDLEEKYIIYKKIAKKILTLLSGSENDKLLFLTNSAGLNHIYRFISDYLFFTGNITLEIPPKIAFFPGAFDPFTLSHKEIVRAIKNMGFEIYLSVDEFSWSKRTQPTLIRKNIINMSVAGEINTYLYPEEFPVNIANKADLENLQNNFKNSKVYLVMGSDVLINASAYKKSSEKFIMNFPHIVFERMTESESSSENETLKNILGSFSDEVILLNLPPEYKDISSTQIRNYIDKNMDISGLTDPLAQRYIYHNNLYRKEPQYKSLVQTTSVNISIQDKFDSGLIRHIASIFHNNTEEAYNNLENLFFKLKGRLIIINDMEENEKILAYAAFHWVPFDQIYQEFKDSIITECVRNSYKGKIILIDGLFAKETEKFENIHQVILTETLYHCLRNDYGYCIFKNTIHPVPSDELHFILERNGFQKLPCSIGTETVMAVDITNPCTLNLDLGTVLKEPFKNNKNIKKAAFESRKKLQEALTKLYPGNLLLPFDRSIIDEVLMKKICIENDVPHIPLNPKQLGPCMCVPFGNVLNGSVVPNTVTKSLHIEKLFAPNVKNFTIGPYPNYLDLKKQIRVIKSFDKPIILVDDILNKGYRLKVLDPLLKEENIHVKKIIVGMLSGRGKELMEIQNREVDCAYFIPNLGLWFNESLLYPYIGGDTLWRGICPQKNLLPSINLILPYTSPYFIKGADKSSLYNLSRISLENAMYILKILEKEYQLIYERKLTLSHLSEIFIYPRYPDRGENITYDLSVNPSVYLERDLEQLNRLENIIIKQ